MVAFRPTLSPDFPSAFFDTPLRGRDHARVSIPRENLDKGGRASRFGATLALCAAAVFGCAGARTQPEPRIEELRQALAAQAEQIARQQQRIEQLELRVSTLAPRASATPARGAPVPEAAPVPGAAVPRSLQTFKVPAPPGGRRPRSPRANPVERAPLLPAEVQLKEPDESALAELQEPLRASVDAVLRDAAGADHAYAQAVQLLNEGAHAEAQRALVAFAAAHPRHEAADNALYLAGLSLAATGDCKAALPLLHRVPAEYPAGDAVAPALLESARCLTRLHEPEARSALAKVTLEFPDTAEAVQARQLLDGLEARR
jgi:TolA-binding protein